MLLRLHLHTVMFEISVRLPWCLRVSLLPELLEQLSDRVVLRDGEGHLTPLTLLLPFHISNLPEDDLKEGESEHEACDVDCTLSSSRATLHIVLYLDVTECTYIMQL